MDSFQLPEPTSEEAKYEALKLYEVLYNYRNWSWLLNSQRPEVPPTILEFETSDRDDAVSVGH